MRSGPWILLVVVLFTGATLRDMWDSWIDRTIMPELDLAYSVEVRDRNDTLLRAFTVDDGRWRLFVSPEHVDERYVRMLVAFEDKRFWSHDGVDFLALIRAVSQAVLNRKVVSGGSTLTMQVARLLENSGTGKWHGKIRQMRLAWALERRLNKNEVLQLYLNLAPFGGNLEGVRAAALSYFGKEPKRLTVAQSALLLAIPQSPAARRPDRHLQNAKNARDRILERLRAKSIIERESAAAAFSETIPAEKYKFPMLAAHLAERVFRQSPTKVKHRLSLDATVQRSLENLAKSSVLGQAQEMSVAILVANHRTGQVLASVGSAGYSSIGKRQGFNDMTQAIRSPGSTLKPMVYAMAMDLGLIHPQTLIDDSPVRFGNYSPRNFDGQYYGELRVADALRLSRNIPVVKLVDEIGPARVMRRLENSGMKPILPSGKPGLAIGLGGLGVTLEDLVRLYAMLARGGQGVDIRWAYGLGGQTGSRVVSPAAAWHVGNILAASTAPEGHRQRNQLAFKTGTSFGHRDAWAIGYDRDHVVGVWMGRADGTPVPGAFGGDLAAPVLFEAFQRLKPQLAPLPPPPPETLLVSTSELPLPLQRFRGRKAAFVRSADAPEISFPPHNSRFVGLYHGLNVKMRNGVPPFTWTVQGKPVELGVHVREIVLPIADIGFVDIGVVDALGQSSHVKIELN